MVFHLIFVINRFLIRYLLKYNTNLLQYWTLGRGGKMCLKASWVLVNIFQVLDNAAVVYFKHSSTVLETMMPEHFVFMQNRNQHWL